MAGGETRGTTKSEVIFPIITEIAAQLIYHADPSHLMNSELQTLHPSCAWVFILHISHCLSPGPWHPPSPAPAPRLPRDSSWQPQPCWHPGPPGVRSHWQPVSLLASCSITGGFGSLTFSHQCKPARPHVLLLTVIPTAFLSSAFLAPFPAAIHPPDGRHCSHLCWP